MRITKFEGTAKELAEFFTETQTNADQITEKIIPKTDTGHEEKAECDETEGAGMKSKSETTLFFTGFDTIIPSDCMVRTI